MLDTLKNIIKKAGLHIVVGTLLASAMIPQGCANTTKAPSGGAKDTIPPVIVSVNPLSGNVNVPVHGAKITITFNEYVTLKNAKNIFLSPPQEKSPKAKISGKSVVVTFENDLDTNTTYTLDFSDAIADNNEGNMFPGYTYVFSTGPQIDTMMMTGHIQDCNTLKDIKGATVLLYKDHADSAIFLHRPDVATRTDDWGYFCLRNFKDTLYRIYALKDVNGNNKYDPDEDLIAFIDSLVRPVRFVNDSLPEVQKYDMKDTLACRARETEYELSLFKGKPNNQMIMNTVRVDERTAYITFMAQKAHIDSLWIKGFPASRVITQFNIQRDSLEIWVNDVKRKSMPDTLHLYVNYRKTDSTGVLQPFLEHVKLYKETDKDTKNNSNSSADNSKEKADTLCEFTLDVKPETVEQVGWELEFKHPIVYEHFDSIQFFSINPKQKESPAEFTVEQDSLNIRKYTLRIKEKMLPGYEYRIRIPKRSFRDITGFYTDSLVKKVSLPNDDALSSLHLNLNEVGSNSYIVDLLNEKRDKVLRSYVVTKDGTYDFPYISKGKYCIRITEDRNGNGIVDTGDLLAHRMPEKVLFFKKGDKIEMEIPEASEIIESINLKAFFNGK